MARSKDVAIARRSGKVPGVIVSILSLAGIVYDESHWHVIHHIFGRISWIFAFLLILGLGWITTILFRREPGYVEISNQGDNR